MICQYGGCEEEAIYQHYFLGGPFLRLCQEHADKVFPLKPGTIEDAVRLASIEDPLLHYDYPVMALNRQTARAFLSGAIPIGPD